MEGIKLELCKTFKIKLMNDVNNFLGIRIIRNVDEKTITLDQYLAISHLIKKFNVENCKVFKTPIESNLKLEKNVDDELKTKLPYKELLGSLMYIMLGTRPDICFAVSYLGKFQDSATDEHFKHLLRVLKYLKSTIHIKLSFCCSNDSKLIGFADTDWAND